jgi:c(7)-type cytochrome triheme protein
MLLLLFFIMSGISYSYFNIRVPPPDMYGDVLINQNSSKNNVTAVVFPHWVHRAKYTCRVCHTELEISLKAGQTGITCNNGDMKGKFCAVCHDGKTAFAPKDEEGDNCKLCHNATSSPNREKFSKLKAMLPGNNFGNEINWAKALKEGMIQPKKSLLPDFKDAPMSINKTLTLKAEMSGISPGVFPHGVHEEWLDCSSCHPEIFNIKKKTTENLRKVNMLKGESCGMCHLKVAFPLNDCKRCHPGMRR